MTLSELAKALRGIHSNGWINIAGPGHGASDKPLGIKIDIKAPDGFWLHSLSGDDEKLCRDHIKRLLKAAAEGHPIEFDTAPKRGRDREEEEGRRKSATRIWAESVSILGTLAAS